MSRLTKFAIFVLACNLLVILWGAYVRATGSGAGCGDHWPLCNGEVLPQAPAAETVIEYVHRITSGIAFVLVAVLWRLARRQHAMAQTLQSAAVLRGALWALVFMVIESLVGALIVMAELTGTNGSAARAAIIAVHQANTLFLLGALALTVFWSARHKPLRWREHPVLGAMLFTGVLGMAVVGSSGAVTALGDALFPKTSIGLADELGGGVQHFLVRLRVLHPVFAACMGVYVAALAWWIRRNLSDAISHRLAVALGAVFLVQAMLGALVIGFLAPVTLQLLHLLCADMVWILLTILGAHALGQPAVAQAAQPAVAAASQTRAG